MAAISLLMGTAWAVDFPTQRALLPDMVGRALIMDALLLERFALMQSSIILLTASDEMRDRAMGTVMIGIGADPLGKLQTGFLAETVGAPIALSVQAGLLSIL